MTLIEPSVIVGGLVLALVAVLVVWLVRLTLGQRALRREAAKLDKATASVSLHANGNSSRIETTEKRLHDIDPASAPYRQKARKRGADLRRAARHARKR